MRSDVASTLAAASSSARASSGPRSWARTSPGASRARSIETRAESACSTSLPPRGRGRLQTSSGGGGVSWGPASVAGAGIITP